MLKKLSTLAALVGVSACATLSACTVEGIVIQDDDASDSGAAVSCDAAIWQEASPDGSREAGPDATRPRDAGPDSTPPRDASPDVIRPIDAGPDVIRPIDAGPDADAGPDGSTRPPACYDETAALALPGTAPTFGQNVCTQADVQSLFTACFGPGASAATCNAFSASHPDCMRCVVGPLPGDAPATTPISALIPAGDASLMVNVGSCAALAIGRPDCAVTVPKQLTCTASACETCADEPSDTACREAAEVGICSSTVDSACMAALTSTAATWSPICRGPDFVATYQKVAMALCGP
ncbi:MAG: hypothetical protein IPK71_01820 [Myxococcales bacterium]|nr:hypothetical protein [Myxococcales bacterium]